VSWEGGRRDLAKVLETEVVQNVVARATESPAADTVEYENGSSGTE